ncbi:MAG: cytochrome c3 family protein [Desulfuromonadales bacterium]
MAALSAVAASNPPKIITFKNNVVFDHEGHKGDCNSCHDSVDGGSKIAGFGKDWAHKTCIDCHKAMGAGPTTCSDCHKK